MSSSMIWVVIALIALGGFALRAAFLVLPLRAELPPRVQFVLGLVPAAALSALVVPALLQPEGQFDLIAPAPLAGLIALAFSLRFGNLALTMAIGLLAYIALDLFL